MQPTTAEDLKIEPRKGGRAGYLVSARVRTELADALTQAVGRSMLADRGEIAPLVHRLRLSSRPGTTAAELSEGDVNMLLIRRASLGELSAATNRTLELISNYRRDVAQRKASNSNSPRISFNRPIIR